mmetsp:Transcript_18067/g.41402  ORF Transcript_18067/g.41402 Transcript_18067/m.41402 type:complete len:81 (+) Transcript_18067:365-607(+)
MAQPVEASAAPAEQNIVDWSGSMPGCGRSAPIPIVSPKPAMIGGPQKLAMLIGLLPSSSAGCPNVLVGVIGVQIAEALIA